MSNEDEVHWVVGKNGQTSVGGVEMHLLDAEEVGAATLVKGDLVVDDGQEDVVREVVCRVRVAPELRHGRHVPPQPRVQQRRQLFTRQVPHVITAFAVPVFPKFPHSR